VPDEQISLDMVADQIGSALGADWQTSYGGGGTGGKYMFASVQELDLVIAQWKDVHEAIRADGDTISAAAGFVEEPAEDSMSVGQADATRQSLVRLKEHNEAMRTYTEDYIKKLAASRASMVNTEQGNAAQLSNIDRS